GGRNRSLSSCELSAAFTELAQGVQEWDEVDFHGMARGLHETPVICLLHFRHLAAHRFNIRESEFPAQIIGDYFGLQLGWLHDGPERLIQADEKQIVDAGHD